ncbi:MAG: TIGR04255 family protein [Deltaproteobacteria bacterium]|nr:TIGR04255 family protein [Deltaproteobacteria bacterium]
MKKIIRCTNSTITEALVILRGQPAQQDDEALGAMLKAGRKKFPDIKKMPSLVIIEKQDGPIPPFWNTQLSWGNNRYVVRLGHQFLSIHFICDLAKDRYDTYEGTLGQPVKDWLEIVSEFSGTGVFKPEKIGFGYVNTFLAKEEKLDLSDYFKINVGIELDPTKTPLQEINTHFRFLQPNTNTKLSFDLRVGEKSGQVQLQTKTSAKRQGIPASDFKKIEDVLKTIVEIKDAAKEAFFALTTDRAKREMGAQYA